MKIDMHCRTFSEDPATSSAPETTAAAPLAWSHIQPSRNDSTSSVSEGMSTFSLKSILPVTHNKIQGLP